MGVGSAISLTTVQNSGSDGRRGAVVARFRFSLFGFAAMASGADKEATAVARGRNRIFEMLDLATGVLRRPLAVALVDPCGMVKHGVERAGLDL